MRQAFQLMEEGTQIAIIVAFGDCILWPIAFGQALAFHNMEHLFDMCQSCRLWHGWCGGGGNNASDQLFPCRWSAIETGQGERWAWGASHAAADATGDCLRSLLPPTLTPSQLPDAPRACCTKVSQKGAHQSIQTYPREAQWAPTYLKPVKPKSPMSPPCRWTSSFRRIQHASHMALISLSQPAN